MSSPTAPKQPAQPMRNIIIFGPPGSGKGTQGARIKSAYGLHHISTGELLRQLIESGDELGQLANSYISQGHLVPDDLAIRILESELDKPEAARGVIFDGFPRTVPQAEALLKMMERRGQKIDHVIGLEVPDDELRERLIKRGIDSGRSDDNAEAIDERLRVYHSLTQPLVDFFTERDAYRPIQGSGSIDDIFDDISRAIGD